MMEEKDIHKILSKEQTENVSVPAWNAIAPSVKKQNFLSFGFKHINIYNLSALLLLLIFWGLNGFQQEIHVKIESTTQEEVNITNKPQHKITTKVAQPTQEIKDEVKPQTIEVDNTPTKTIGKPTKEETTSTHINTYNEPTIPLDIVEAEPDIISEPEIITETPIAKPLTKGKTIIVFETDTVVQYDTLIKDKRIKSRK